MLAGHTQIIEEAFALRGNTAPEAPEPEEDRVGVSMDEQGQIVPVSSTFLGPGQGFQGAPAAGDSCREDCQQGKRNDGGEADCGEEDEIQGSTFWQMTK